MTASERLKQTIDEQAKSARGPMDLHNGAMLFVSRGDALALLGEREAAQSQLDALREEVARLTKERDAAIEDAKEIRTRWNDAENEFAALKAQPTDVDALMALADDYALRYFQCIRHGTPDDVANKNATREALRAKLAARKEPT